MIGCRRINRRDIIGYQHLSIHRSKINFRQKKIFGRIKIKNLFDGRSTLFLILYRTFLSRTELIGNLILCKLHICIFGTIIVIRRIIEPNKHIAQNELSILQQINLLCLVFKTNRPLTGRKFTAIGTSTFQE